MNRRHLISGFVLTIALSSAVTLIVQRVGAQGIPDPAVLTYTGYLENPDGTPVTAAVNILLEVFNAETAGAKLCEQSSMGVTPVRGRFQIELPVACTDAVKANPDLWVQVTVGGGLVGRTKLGAVPYAVEADHAVAADVATQANNAGTLESLPASSFQRRHANMSSTCNGANQSIKTIAADGTVTCETDDNTTYTAANGLVPAGMIGVFATACPAGWTLCDGAGGTPNLVGAYIKGGTAFAAQTGTNSHTHPIGITTSSDGLHTHSAGVSIMADGAHSHVALLNWGTNAIYADFDTMSQWTSDWHVTGTLASASSAAHTALSGPRTTLSTDHNHPGSTVTISAFGAHTHFVSGNSASQSHEPVRATVVFCRKD